MAALLGLLAFTALCVADSAYLRSVKWTTNDESNTLASAFQAAIGEYFRLAQVGWLGCQNLRSDGGCTPHVICGCTVDVCGSYGFPLAGNCGWIGVAVQEIVSICSLNGKVEGGVDIRHSVQPSFLGRMVTRTYVFGLWTCQSAAHWKSPSWLYLWT